MTLNTQENVIYRQKHFCVGQRLTTIFFNIDAGLLRIFLISNILNYVTTQQTNVARATVSSYLNEKFLPKSDMEIAQG